jgi:tetratricopeptide (TPR) repeat protein
LGKQPEAADYAERGMRKAREAGAQVVVNQCLILLNTIYRAQGQGERAKQMLAEVEPHLRHDLPPGHLAFASIVSEHSMNARASNDLANALELSNQAIAMTETSIKSNGQGMEYLPTVLIRRADLELQLGQAKPATVDALRGLDMLLKDAPPGSFSSRIGRAYSAVARALDAEGKHQEAKIAARSAAEHFRIALGPDHPDTRAALKMARD